MSSKDQAIIEYINTAFDEYIGSPLVKNWILLCDNILDACEQKYRPGEQLTRQGMYFGVMRAQRDGWKDGGMDLFGQARPLFTYKPRRDVPPKLADKTQEVMLDIWRDISGLTKWAGLWRDMVEHTMSISYSKYCRAYGEAEGPRVVQGEYGEMLDWDPSFDVLADTPDFLRVHPRNYRCSIGAEEVPTWEGIDWEWTANDLMALQGDDAYNQPAIRRLLDKLEKGEIGQSQKDFYSVAQSRGGDKKRDGRIIAREYWGTLTHVDGMAKDKSQHVVIICEGEILRKQVSRLRIGGRVWRPIKRARLDPINDLPFGGHVLAPTLSHQRMKNLMLNLAADDLLIRQHIGLAAWRGSLENPNQLLNPESAREPLWMRHDASADRMPRFFADQSSGVVRDVMQFDSQVIERDLQVNGLPYQALGLGGGAQGKTATEQSLLANSASRKVRVATIYAIETGLDPICKDLLGLYLRNNSSQDLRLSPQDQANIFLNNFFEFDSTLTTNMSAQAMAYAQWGQMAMQQMSAISPAGQPGSADHMVRFLKDSGKLLGLQSSALDAYLPEGMPVQIPQGQPPAQPGQLPAQPPEPQPEMMGAADAMA